MYEIKRELKYIDGIKKIDGLLSKYKNDSKWMGHTSMSIDAKWQTKMTII